MTKDSHALPELHPRPGCGRLRWFRRSLVLTALGQFGTEALGGLAPGIVRFPGGWAPVLTPDSPGYLEAATRLPALPSEYLTKVVYLLLLRGDQALSLGGWGIILLQFIGLALAGAVVGRAVAIHHGDRAAFLAVAVLVLNPQISQWVKAVLTDSLFISLVVILAIQLSRFLEERTSVLLPLGIALSLVFLRPNGIGAALAALLVVTWSMERFRVAASLSAIALASVVVLGSPAFQSPGGENNTLADRTYEGLVIWMGEDDVTTPMPKPNEPDDVSNRGLIRYAASNPLPVARLGLLRIWWELVQVRPHYPLAVNVVVGLQMVLFYGLAGLGLRRNSSSTLTHATCAMTVGLLLVIGATWAIAEGRFGWAILAMWSPLVGIGAERLMQRAPWARNGSGG